MVQGWSKNKMTLGVIGNKSIKTPKKTEKGEKKL